MKKRQEKTITLESEQMDTDNQTCTFKPQISQASREICEKRSFVPISKNWENVVKHKEAWLEKERELKEKAKLQLEKESMVPEYKNPNSHYRDANYIWERNEKFIDQKNKTLGKVKADKIKKESEELIFRPKTARDPYKNKITSSFMERQNDFLKKKANHESYAKKIIKEFEPYSYKPKLNTKSLRIAEAYKIRGCQTGRSTREN